MKFLSFRNRTNSHATKEIFGHFQFDYYASGMSEEDYCKSVKPWSGKNAYGFYFWLNLVDLRRNKMAVEKSDLDECYKKLVRESIEKKTREVREKIEEMMRELA